MKKELIKQVLDAMLSARVDCNDFSHTKKDLHKYDEQCRPKQRWDYAIALLHAELDRPKPEPAAWMRDDGLPDASDCCTTAVKDVWLGAKFKFIERYTIPLYKDAP